VQNLPNAKKGILPLFLKRAKNWKLLNIMTWGPLYGIYMQDCYQMDAFLGSIEWKWTYSLCNKWAVDDSSYFHFPPDPDKSGTGNPAVASLLQDTWARWNLRGPMDHSLNHWQPYHWIQLEDNQLWRGKIVVL
jgi:hypothetical protein